MTPVRRLLLTALLVLGLLVAVAASASGDTRFYVRGAGYGHGIGMSQYGAYGYALHGRDYRTILRHYYQGTALGTVPSGLGVRVLLLQSGRVAFSGASGAGGKRLSPTRRYVAAPDGGGGVVLSDDAGHTVGRFGGSVRLGGHGPLRLGGRALNGVASGRYRGALVLTRRGGSIAAINALRIDDYVRGVVAGEMPSSWAREALSVQAVAARSYALGSGAGTELYPDTRSQVYDGVSAETARTNAAVRVTRGQIVTYHGALITTFFFSTSGGRTENVENSFLGSSPKPYLRSVSDPYDRIAPLHRWRLAGMTLDQAGRRLRGLVRGRFRGIRVTRRGRSPRVVSALVLGTSGDTRVSGPTLRARLGLYDTWAYFNTVSAGKRSVATTPPAKRAASASNGDGAAATAVHALDLGLGAIRPPAAVTQRLEGTIEPAPARGRAAVERREGASWRRVGTARLTRGGSYGVSERVPGRYRVVYAGMASPEVQLP